jgi:hypothetical protein
VADGGKILNCQFSTQRDGKTPHFQQDHSSIHDSRVVQEWLSLQADVELIGRRVRLI